MRYSLAVQWNKINSDRMRRNRNSPHRDRVINATMKFIPSTALYFSFLSQNYDSYLWLIRFLGTGMVRRTLISLKLTKKREIVKHTVLTWVFYKWLCNHYQGRIHFRTSPAVSRVCTFEQNSSRVIFVSIIVTIVTPVLMSHVEI